MIVISEIQIFSKQAYAAMTKAYIKSKLRRDSNLL